MLKLVNKDVIGFVLVLLITAFPLDSWTQEKAKWEQEFRVEESQVPAPARSALDSWSVADIDVRWFLERGKESLSYEAKFKWEKHRYSIEFDEQGALEDIEIELRFKEIPDSIRQELCSDFEAMDNFKLKRIQAHWKHWPEVGDTLWKRFKESPPDLYEIEFKAVMDGKLALWEGQFDLQGNLLSYREILLRSTDNIDL